MTITLEDLQEDTNADLLGDDLQAEETAGSETKAEEQQKVETDKPNDDKQDEVADTSNKGAGHVPAARLAEVVAERNKEREAREALEQRIKELEAKTTQATTQNEEQQGTEQKQTTDYATTMKALIAEKNEALLDGDLEKVSAIEFDMAEMSRKENLRLIEERNSQKEAETESGNLLNGAIKLLTDAYPQFDSAKENYDADAVASINKLAKLNVAEGMKPHEALIDAANEIAQLRGYKQNATNETDKRKDQALKNAIKTNEQQPPAMGGVGNRGASLSVKDLNQKEYEKLPEAERNKLLE